jgi:AcrR family transcriptional regulator
VTAASANANANAGIRRAPAQRRSRERVQRILDAASDLIVDSGVADLSTRMVAERAGIPVASLYQYFGDKDEIILALVERDTAESDTAVTAAVGALDSVSVRTIVTATMRAFVTTYHQRPAFVVVWWRGRTNRAVYDFCRARNKRIAADLFAFAREAGLVKAGTVPQVVELAVEVGDRIFQLAFEHDIRGDEMVIDEGIELIIGYLERHATDGATTATRQL